ncbi:lysophospholipase [Chitinimonas arctica]|uniref:Lysophospholipase n=1 Tax=Chitinimonas arctica TaxID=2594795 RepID=A0A516S9Z1_9NEIS|nr:alpha/beta fold hydrolase [Chitinimonas arctica]QDQ24974.1 lysophospholipase [Chitinimonas arctica]
MNSPVLTVKSTNVRNIVALTSLRACLGTLASFAPGLAAAWAERLFLRPPRHDWPRVEQAWRDRAERSELYTAGLPISEWDGKPMRIYRWGEARHGKVVMLHGWGGRATQFHEFIAPLTAAGYQVVGIDAPGHGASHGNQASVLHFAHALTRVIRNEGPVTAVLAHSLGGAATVYALASHKLAVEKVVLISPSADVAAYARYIGRLLNLDKAVLAGVQQRMETRFGILWQELNAISLAGRLDLPALILHDRNDREVPSSTGAKLAEAWQGARLLLTEGLGHRRILRDAAVVREAVAFLRK